MAIVAIKEKSTLKLELDNGIVDGRQRILSKNFSKVKTDATDEGLHGRLCSTLYTKLAVDLVLTLRWSFLPFRIGSIFSIKPFGFNGFRKEDLQYKFN